MDVGGGLLAAGNVEVPAPGRAGADEHRIEALGKQALQALDPLAEAKLHPAEAGDIADLLVDHLLREAEPGDLAADHAARPRLAVEQDQLIAEGREVAGHGQRGRAGAHQGHPLAVPLRRDRRHEGPDVLLVVGRHALEPADGHRLLLDPSATAGRLAGPVAGPPQDAGEDVRLPVDHVGVIVPAIGDQADVFRHGRVGRAGPLAVDYLVIVVRPLGTRWLQDPFPPRSPGGRGLILFRDPVLGRFAWALSPFFKVGRRARPDVMPPRPEIPSRLMPAAGIQESVRVPGCPLAGKG